MSAVNASVSTADTTSITNTPSSKKNYKPKKGHLPKAPLCGGMNLQRVASDHQVDGPSDLHVQKVSKSSPGSPNDLITISICITYFIHFVMGLYSNPQNQITT